MSIEEKRKELTVLLENIKQQLNHTEPIEKLAEEELDAMLASSTNLRDGILILKYMIENKQDDVEELVEMSEEKEEVIEENIIVEESTLEEKLEIKEKEEEDDELFDEEKMDAEGNGNNEEELDESTEEAIVLEKKETKEEHRSMPDINEAFSVTGDNSLSNQLQKQPITDLLSAIALNERYLYANELFDGDIEDFRRVMGLLNEFETGEEANGFFEKELRKNYGWEEHNELAMALSQLVMRRFQSQIK